MSDDVSVKSYTEVLVKKFVEEGLRRLAALSENDLAGVVYWVETKQMELMQVLATEDDALTAAKYRGGIEHFAMASEEVRMVLKERLAKRAEAEAEAESD